jgi:spore maturation protein CgeB
MIELRRSSKVAEDGIGRYLYKVLCYKCGTALRTDKRRQVEDLARDAETAANKRDSKQLYSITKKLANHNHNSRQILVRNKMDRF